MTYKDIAQEDILRMEQENMTEYEEAREKVAWQLCNNFCNGSDYSVCLNNADQILSTLLTPSELKEWKAGGKLGVITRDQSLPVVSICLAEDYEANVKHNQEVMVNSGFRRVVKEEDID